jgi:hypothetical protein
MGLGLFYGEKCFEEGSGNGEWTDGTVEWGNV